MRNRKKKEPVAFEVIEAAVAGDVVAINQIVDYFQPYINSRCRRKFIDESGQIKYGIDEYIIYETADGNEANNKDFEF